MNLSFRQLNTFREVIRSGSLSQAARTLGRTQPAVSAMIAGLEAELGFLLFKREHGKLTPTPEARYFLEECEDILSRLERTKRTMSGISKLQSGRLRIACHPAASGFFLPRALTSFLKDKPDIDVSLMMRSSTVIEDLIASQQFDIGFAETPPPRTSIVQKDFELDCVCLLPADDPLTGKSTIAPRDLDGADLAMLFSGHETYVQTARAFADAGCSFRRRFELQTSLPGVHFVAARQCYMICDMITAFGSLDGSGVSNSISVRAFDPAVVSRVSILTPAHATRSVVADAFSFHLSDQVKQMKTEMANLLSG